MSVRCGAGVPAQFGAAGARQAIAWRQMMRLRYAALRSVGLPAARPARQAGRLSCHAASTRARSPEVLRVCQAVASPQGQASRIPFS